MNRESFPRTYEWRANLQALTFFSIILLFHAVCILRPEASEEFWQFTKLWQFTECIYVAVQLLTERTHKLKWLVNVHACPTLEYLYAPSILKSV